MAESREESDGALMDRSFRSTSAWCTTSITC